MVDLAAQIFRDFNTDGDPGSGAHKVVKSEVREWGTWVEGELASSTFDDDIEIEKSDPTLFLNKTAGGQGSYVIGEKGGLRRWAIALGDPTAEGGSDSGSLFALYRYTDDGALKDTFLAAHRDIDRLEFLKGQLGFPATQNPSANANTLDDYEEGTFTPTFSATGCTFSYASQIGHYTKIGNRVIASVRIALNGSGNTLAANNLSIAGMPFANGNSVSIPAPLIWFATTASYLNMGVLMGAGSTSLAVVGMTAAGVNATGTVLATNGLHATNGSIYNLTIVYHV